MFSDTFAGIAPTSVPPFIAAQIIGGLAGLALAVTLYPDVAQTADEAVIPHNIAHAHPEPTE
jgi:arsenate reductase